MRQLLLTILKSFFPLLFIAYMGCISLFTHSHVVNGVTIVHSHPFDKDGEHTHTATEFQLIFMLSHVSLAEGAVACLIFTVSLILLHRIIYFFLEKNIVIRFLNVISLRAPPCMV